VRLQIASAARRNSISPARLNRVRPLGPRAREDARLTERIRELHAKRRGVYGSPRIWSDLSVEDGERIGRKRLERLMRQAGLSGLITKKWRTPCLSAAARFSGAISFPTAKLK
jgi:transposase InsO family protein